MRYNEGPDLLYRRCGGPRDGRGEQAGRDEADDMCFLASRGIIILELTADERERCAKRKVGGVWRSYKRTAVMGL